MWKMSAPTWGGHVGPVVDREQFLVFARHVGQQVQCGDLRIGIQGLVPQLDDVDPTGERGLQDILEVTLLLAGVGA